MKTYCILLLVVLLAGCNRDDRSPVEIAEHFQRHYQQQEFESVMPLLVDSTREALRYMVSDSRQFAMDWPDSSRILPATINQGERTASIQVENWFRGVPDTAILQLAVNHDAWRVVYRRYDPVHAARSFLKAFHEGVWQEAARFTDDASLRDLEVVANYYKGWQGPEVTITGVEFNDDTSKAIVSYREKGNDMTKRISLVVDEEGHWKVSFSKKATF